MNQLHINEVVCNQKGETRRRIDSEVTYSFGLLQRIAKAHVRECSWSLISVLSQTVARALISLALLPTHIPVNCAVAIPWLPPGAEIPQGQGSRNPDGRCISRSVLSLQLGNGSSSKSQTVIRVYRYSRAELLLQGVGEKRTYLFPKPAI